MIEHEMMISSLQDILKLDNPKIKKREKLTDEKGFLSIRKAALNKRKCYLYKVNAILKRLAKELLVYTNFIYQKEEDYKVISKEILNAFMKKYIYIQINGLKLNYVIRIYLISVLLC